MKQPSTKRTKRGVVIRKSGDKSVIVRVERMVQEPTFKKYVRRHRNFHVHDEQNACQIGDAIMIHECRPMSRTKHWAFETLLTRGTVVAAAEGAL